jgi:hypothetical protein
MMDLRMPFGIRPNRGVTGALVPSPIRNAVETICTYGGKTISEL